MDQNDNQLQERHQILPDYNLEMEYSALFNDSDDELDIMSGFYGQKEAPEPPKKPLPKLKKLRVRVKRLTQTVIQRYLKKNASQVGSSLTPANRLIQRPVHKPYPQQLIINKTLPQIRQIVKLATAPQSGTAQLNPLQWHIKQQALAGQKQGAILNTKRPIPVKLLPGNIIKLGQSNAHMKRSLPNAINIGPVKKRLETIEAGNSKAITIVKNSTVVDAKSKSLKEAEGDSSFEKWRVHNWAIKDILSIKEQLPKGPIVTKIVNGKQVIVRSSAISKSGETSPKNVTSIKTEENKPMGIAKQSSVKIPLKTIQQLQLGRTVNDGTKPNVQVFKEAKKNLSDLNRSKGNIIVLPNQKTSTSVTSLNKSLMDRSPQDKDLSGKLRKEENRSSMNINISKNRTPLAADAMMTKQPKIVKVPVAKLIKIPQGLKIVTNSEKQGRVVKPINNGKNIEKVNMSKVIMSSDMKSIKNVKISESFKLTKQIKSPEVVRIPQSTKITNVVKSPSAIQIVNLPIKHSLPATMFFNPKAVTSKDEKSQETVITKEVQSPKAATAVGKSNPKICGKLQSQCPQTDASQQTATKMGNRSVKTCPSKNTQTKFTCNENICAIIDAGDFSINCFYCYDTFSIRKWPEFIRHMKTAHHLKGHSLAAANALLSPNNIIPNATKSKQVQVNTLKGRPIEGGKKKINPMEAIANERKNLLSLDDAASLLDDSQLDNDLEMALNYLDGDESDDLGVLSTHKFEKLSPKTIVKLEDEGNSHTQAYTLVEPKIEQKAAQITIIPKIEATDNPLADNNGASETIQLGNRTLGKNKIINLPSNIKIIGRLPKIGSTTEHPQTVTVLKTPDTLTKNNSSKFVVIDNLMKSMSTVKSKDSNESCKTNTSMEESIDSILEELTRQSSTINQSNQNKSDDDNYELAVSCVDESFTIEKNISLDISQTNVEQNIKIEPHYDIECGNENEHLKPKEGENIRHRTYINSRKNISRGHKSRPIPSNLLDSDDEMPSNDENEDEYPSPTNGCGILFGLTNRNIVIDFIENLQKFPELWQFSRCNDITVNYSESIRKLYEHINHKFNLEMTDFEVRLSVQRIKHWYCRTLQKIERHNRDPQPKKLPFRITFPEYFNLLGKFLTYNSNCTRDLVLGKRFQRKDVNEMNRYPKWMIYKDPVPGDNKEHPMVTDEKCSLARDLELSDYGEYDPEEEAEAEARSMKPFKSEQDTSAAPPDPFICDICFVDFNSMGELVRHRLRHFSPQYPCTVCKRKHYSAYAAENCAHSATKQLKSSVHTTDCTQFVCELCGISYRSMGSLNYHKKDKHFNLRQKCPVCKFTSISNYRMVQHQKKRHVVEFGTCEQIAIKTRARTDSKVPFDTEARREFEWRREMRKSTKPGEHFFGCYKCKIIFNTRKEKIQHNRQEHPITEFTVMCLLCKREKSLLSNSNSVRRHYTDVHKVPWDEIDDLVKNTKPLFQVLSPLEVDQLKSSENPCEFVTKLLMRKHKAEAQNTSDKDCEISRAMKTTTEGIEEELNHSYDPFKFENNADKEPIVNDFLMSNEESLDNEFFQSSFFNDIGIDQDYHEMQEDSLYDDDENDEEFLDLHAGYGDSVALQNYEYPDEEGNENYFIEEECMEDEEYNNDVVPQSRQQQVLLDMENGANEEEIVEETVEYDFIENVMDERF